MKNKGFSLVELLVGIAISAIVAGSIGYLLTTSLRMFGNETTDVSQQQELQTTLNTIIDYAMESQTVVLKNTSGKTDYLALGTVDDANSKNLKEAEIFFTDDNNRLYMCKTPINDYEKEYATSPKNLDERVKEIRDNALGNPDSLAKYLLAENVTGFYAELNGTRTTESGRYYTNPLSLDLTLQFSKKGASKIIDKKVSDKAVFRNTLSTKIFVNNLDYSFKKEDALNITTDTVNMNKNAAIIQIPGTKVVPKPNLNILEIVPDYSYDYAQFVVGGYKGDLINSKNVTYGASATFNPISATELEGYILQTCGATDSSKGNTGSNNKTMISGFYPNIGVDLPAIVQTAEANRNGYYEYVGAENGGIYAIDSYEVIGNLALNPGMGESKPVVLGYTKSYNPTWEGDKKNWTEKVFNPVFKYYDHEESGKDYYMAERVSSGRNDYESVIVVTDNVTGEKSEIIETDDTYTSGVLDGKTQQYQYYRYVGNGRGDVSLNFYKYNIRDKGTYNKQNGLCYAVDEEYDAIDKSNGDYYAIVGEWKTRDISSGSVSYEWGYDFDQKVSSAVMYSKYFNHPQPSKAESQDFGWVWHEAEVGTYIYDEIANGDYFTYAGTLNEAKTSGKRYDIGTKLYLKDHYRYSLVNNELFKLYVMQDTLEQYVDGSSKMIDILNGCYDVRNNKYSDVNNTAVKRWEDAGNLINLNVRIPSDLTDADIANCDMIVVGTSGDGGFYFANQWSNAIRGTTGTKEFSLSNDITFKQATEIYKRVCADEIAIACPYNLKSVGGQSGQLNLSKMYYMTYCITNWDFVSVVTDEYGNTQWAPEAVKIDTVRKHIEEKKEEQGENNYWTINPDYMKDIEKNVMAKGCGRDFFKDYLRSMSGQELSKFLYENGTLGRKTTDIIYIDADGNIVVPGRSTKSVWGAGGGSSLSDFEANFLLCNTDNYLMDRYRADMTAHKKNSFVFNPQYHLRDNVEDKNNPKAEDYCGHYYKFYYDDAQKGINKNMLLYNQESDLFSFSMTGAYGMLQLKTINQNATPYIPVDEPEDVGTIELVGYGVGDYVEVKNPYNEEDDRGRYNLPSNHEGLTYIQCLAGDPEDNRPPMYYQHTFEELGDGNKVAYISDEELEQAKQKNNGIFVYMLIKSDRNWYPTLTAADADNEYMPYLRYSRDPKVSNVFPEWPGEAVRYAKEDGQYVTEFRAQIPYYYFIKNNNPAEFVAPTNNGDNMITAQFGADGEYNEKNKTTEMFGSETFYICVRDTLDLD